MFTFLLALQLFYPQNVVWAYILVYDKGVDTSKYIVLELKQMIVTSYGDMSVLVHVPGEQLNG